MLAESILRKGCLPGSRRYITDQEPVEWSTVESWMTELEECIERHRDVKTELKKVLPTYHEAS